MTDLSCLRTPLYDAHIKAGARMVPFAGWEMPVQYKAGLVTEHQTVRQKAGLFDVSHMGEIDVTGPGALALVQQVTCNDASKLQPGRGQYSALLTPEGGVIDDLIVYRRADNHFFLCVNASNATRDFEWIRSHRTGDVEVINRSDDYALLALQGPMALTILERVLGAAAIPAKRFWLTAIASEFGALLVARTGYTGEDGVEIFCEPGQAPALWARLLEVGGENILPCGLGARDTLRLEAALCLHGHEISESINPLEAGLGWIVKLDKGDFIGAEALRRIKGNETRRLVGLELTERGVAREHYRLFSGEREIGEVTSGTQTPTLGKAIAMGYVPIEFAADGTTLQVDIRGKKYGAIVVPTPFYKKT